MADTREKALDVLKDNRIGVLSTISGDQPYSRYMTFFNEGFILYTMTDKRTHKVEDMQNNPNVFVLLGYEEGLFKKTYIEMVGQVDITEDHSLIEHLWSPAMHLVFEGKEDPNIVVLRIKPKTVSLRNNKDDEVIELNLE